MRLCRKFHAVALQEAPPDALLDVAERLARTVELVADFAGVLLVVDPEPAVAFDIAGLDAVLTVFVDHQVDKVEAVVVFAGLDFVGSHPRGRRAVEGACTVVSCLVVPLVVHLFVREGDEFHLLVLALRVADAVPGRHVHAVGDVVLEAAAIRVVGFHALPEDIEDVVIRESGLEVAGVLGFRPARDTVWPELVRLLHEGVEGFEQTVLGIGVSLADCRDEGHLLFVGEVVLGGGVLGVFHRHKSLFPASMVGHECCGDAPVLGYRVMGIRVGVVPCSQGAA